MNIEKDVSDVLVHGTTNLTTANTPKQVVPSTVTTKPKKGVQFKAGVSNSGSIFLGSIAVGGTTTNANCGLELEAGDQIFLPCEDPHVVYAYNPTANDVCHWIIM